MSSGNKLWHKFSLDNHFFLYSTQHKQAIEIDETLFKGLNLCHEMQTANNLETIETYFRRFPIVKPKKLKKKTYDVFLLVANACNARCIYCFAEGGTYGKKIDFMNQETGRTAIDFFFSYIPNDYTINLNFFGGEPLLAIETIEYIINYISFSYPSRRIVYSVTTNGYILNEEILNFLTNHNVHIVLSIDGGRETQCRQRPLLNGKNSFDEVTKIIPYMKRTGQPILARATYHDFNKPLCQIYNDLLLMGIDEIQVVPDFSNINCTKDINKLCSQVDGLYDYIKYYIRNIMYQPERFPFVTVVQAIRFLYFAPYEYSFSCENGKTMFAVDTTGNIFPCHRLSSDERYIIGNIKTGFQTSSSSRFSDCTICNDCSSCWNQYTCTHNCVANTTPLASVAFCTYAKKMTEVAIALTAQMDKKDISRAIRMGSSV